MGYLSGILLLLFGVAVGLFFPDLDQRLPFLLHRSIITHAGLWALVLFACTHRARNPALRLLALGFSEALAIHLGFDLFPNAWSGYALISLPFVGRTSPTFSWLWLALSILLCLVVVVALVRNAGEAVLAAITLIVAFAAYALAEQVLIWWEVVALGVAITLALALRGWYGHVRRGRRWREGF
jgi:hypothetical protein